MIPESYYVDVNINYLKATVVTGSVPKTALISATATATKDYTTLQQVASDYETTTPEYLAAQIYFANGGRELLIYQETSTDEEAISGLLSSYSDFVWVVFSATKTASQLQTISTALSSSTQSLPKFLAYTTSDQALATTLSGQGLSNIALLYSADGAPYTAIVIPAYFSGINLTSANSLLSIVHTQVSGVEASDITTALLTTLYTNNYNVVVNLGDRYTILDGGKMIDGQPIHSAWGFAVFKSDCEKAVTDLLVNKLPYANSSSAVIENALNAICYEYVTNGLIGTDKSFNETTQVVNYNGVDYTTIRNGEVLTTGYKVYSIPIGNALTTDKEVGRIPPINIYAIINDVIRLVTITGEVTK